MKPKTKEELAKMAEGGRYLAEIKNELIDMVDTGVSAMDIEAKARLLIKKTGGSPSFTMVDNYHWATCVNVNQQVVHGIPKKETVFKENDVVSVDVGLYFKGFHTDTSMTKYLGSDKKIINFLKIGESALNNALMAARAGNKISDISREMEKVEEHGYSVMRNLVGHGIGRNLHEDPQIPCYVAKGYDQVIPEDVTLAIEIMYTFGEPEVILEEDNWTISTHDGKISALFEETVATTQKNPIVLSRL